MAVQRQRHETIEGIWTIDAEGKTLFASESMARLLRTTVDEMIGKPSFDYVFPEDAPAAQRLFESKSRGDMQPIRIPFAPQRWNADLGKRPGDPDARRLRARFAA